MTRTIRIHPDDLRRYGIASGMIADADTDRLTELSLQNGTVLVADPDVYSEAAEMTALDHRLAYLESEYDRLLTVIRALHDLVDQTDPADPIGAALSKVGLERRP
jgi:hypothetical protein